MQITRTSIFTGKERTRDLPITDEQWAAFEGGALIQDAFPHLTDGDREFILTGTSEQEWDEAFADDGEDFHAEERADAESDLKRYCELMAKPNGWSGCLEIEKKWGLAGATPEQVTSELKAIAEDEPAF